MAATKIPKGIELITQFVRGQFAKRSAKKTGIAGLKKASDSIVQSNVRNIQIRLKDMGVDINNLKSTDDVLKHMNIHKAMMNQHLRQQFGTLNLDKGIKSLEKKQPFQGFTPKIVPNKRAEFLKKYTKDGQPNDVELNALVTEHKILSKEAERLGEAGERYEDFTNMNNRIKEIEEVLDFMKKEFPGPEDFASGGRIGYAAGTLVKGGKWFLKSLYDTKKQLMQLDMPLSKKQELMKQADDAIKHIEGGGPIPEQIIQHIRKDPKFKSVSQGPRSADPDLAEMEEVILEYGQRHAEGGRASLMYGGDPGFAFEYGGSWADWHEKHRDTMPVEQYIQTKLPKERLPFREMQSGGLAYMLGEPTYMNRPGYSSGLLVKLAKLLKGKKKNVWRGFETDYKNILRGDMYPGEFSGRFFTPDKDLAKWYAMRQGTLTGKVKKLKLTEEEIKAAQEFAEKNLDIQYADDLLVSEELAKKAKVDLPATALAKIEAVIRKAKHTKKAKKHGQTDWAEGGIARASGGLAYMLGEPTYMKYGAGGSVGHAPWHKPTGQAQPPAPMDTPTPHVAGTPDPLKAPRGIPSLAPKNMDPAYMQQQMMQKAMMGRGPGTPGQGPRTMANAGGRIGFKLGGIDKGRRAFMKWLAGIMGTGVAAGTGLLKLGTKAAPKVIKEAEVIARGADGIPKYVTDLIEVVKAKGTKDIIEGFKKSDYSTVHSYKGVDVIEDPIGNIKIKSDKSGVATDPYTGKSHEGISQENHIQIEKGQMQVKDEGLETQKSFREPDEYFEGTVYPDMDGKMKDMQEGLDEAIHLDFKKIADELHEEGFYYPVDAAKKLKKASGGLAYMLGE